jgi:hypothetical protein
MDFIKGKYFSNITSSNDVDIFFMKTEYVNEFFKNCNKNKKFIIISHTSDALVTFNPRQYNTMPIELHANANLIPENCIKWFSSMVDCVHEKIVPLPLGIENNDNFENFINKNYKVEKRTDKLLFVNFKISNNYSERIEAFNSIKHKDFVTITDSLFTTEQLSIPTDPFPYVSKIDNDEFWIQVKSHDFVLCPTGNGPDSHRLWETLYLGSIPIVKRRDNYIFYEDKLPIVFVDDYNEINKEFLYQKKIEIDNKIKNNIYDFDMLNFQYWKNKILDR